MEAALGTVVGTLQREWYWTRALDARAVGAAALMVVGSGDGVQWLSQGSVSAAAVTLAQGSAGRPWLVQARQWLSARLSDSMAQVGMEGKFGTKTFGPPPWFK